ncbi:flagellar biosynthetic protein FliO [Motilibacter sp. K478]|nr:flagellar biosynthetic protein FliO [Motilibacter aurantiacus]NHC47112.1 flagellar biosynthetic protein FliO [Motilibacter aurantiacus]
MLLRLFLSLGVVIALMWLAARVLRGSMGGRNTGALEILARQQLSRGASVSVVRVADRALVVGVTDTQVTLLTETDLELIQLAQEAGTEATDADADTSVSVDEDGNVRIVTAKPARPAVGTGPLAGSILSPDTWRRTVNALRERSTRR